MVSPELLVIEPDPAAELQLRELLAGAPVRWVCVRTAREARALLRDPALRLVIARRELPDEDGLELLTDAQLRRYTAAGLVAFTVVPFRGARAPSGVPVLQLAQPFEALAEIVRATFATPLSAA